MITGNCKFKTAKGTREEMLTIINRHHNKAVQGIETTHPKKGTTILTKGKSKPRAINKGERGTAKMFEIREIEEK